MTLAAEMDGQALATHKSNRKYNGLMAQDMLIWQESLHFFQWVVDCTECGDRNPRCEVREQPVCRWKVVLRPQSCRASTSYLWIEKRLMAQTAQQKAIYNRKNVSSGSGAHQSSTILEFLQQMRDPYCPEEGWQWRRFQDAWGIRHALSHVMGPTLQHGVVTDSPCSVRGLEEGKWGELSPGPLTLAAVLHQKVIFGDCECKVADQITLPSKWS